MDQVGKQAFYVHFCTVYDYHGQCKGEIMAVVVTRYLISQEREG